MKTVTIEQFPDKQSLAPKYVTEQKQIDATIAKVLSSFKEEDNTKE